MKIKSFAFSIISFLFIFFEVHAEESKNEYSIVFVHIGDKLPSYLENAMEQAQLFNPNADIYLIAGETALKKLPEKLQKDTYKKIYCERLRKTPAHRKFNNTSTLNKFFRDGFCSHTAERFLYLNDFITQYEITNMFHLENDVLLYADLSTMLPTFISEYKGVAATFDNEVRCVPGFVYVANKDAMNKLADFMGKNASKGLNDMEMLALYKNQSKREDIDYLPIIHSDFVKEDTFKSKMGHIANNKERFHNNLSKFDSIFDAAAFGQYLGGQNPDNGPCKPGFINECCLFNVSKVTIEWEIDEKGRKVPFGTYNGTKYRINNLHIHSKKLYNFLSAK